MFYLIYDGKGEFYDVVDFTPEELNAYKRSNPFHTAQLAENQEELLPFSDEELEEFKGFDDSTDD